jgi:hypothetical protein
LDLNELLEHALTEHDQLCELKVESVLTALHVERNQGQLKCLDHSVEMLDKLLAVSDFVAVIEFLKVHVVQVAAAKGMRHFEEEDKLIEVRLSYDADHISQLHCSCLQIANHKQQHVKYPVEGTLLAFDLRCCG